MATVGFCKIDNMTLNQKSKYTVEQIHGLMERANVLSTLVGAAALYDIFSGKASVYTASKTIYEYDWDLFVDAMMSVPKITRRMIRDAARQQMFYTSGKEQKFWECVSDAAM